MHIRINDFAGTLPKLHPTKLPDYAAQSCQNVMVEHGVLTPSNQASNSYASNIVGAENFVSAMFFDHDGKTYKKFSNELAKFAFSPVHDAYRLYWTTEDKKAPLMFNDWDVGGASDEYELVTDNFDYIAGLPAPEVKDTVITGITPPVVEQEPVEGEEPAEPITYASITDAIKDMFKKAMDGQNSSGVDKKEGEISDAVAEIIANMPDDVEARVYALTYVNRFGDESAPGVIEEVLYLTKGDEPILTIPYAEGTRTKLTRDYGINAIRLYRSVTNSIGVAQFLFVKEYLLTMTGDSVTLIDDMPYGSTQIGEPLVTMNYDQPRVGMKGLGVTNSGVGYGYVDKTICLSEPYTLYAWPRFYELISQHTIMGLGHYDNTIVVATTGNPILISGSDPESMSVLSLPLYEGCVSPRSMVNLNHGCMYASENGLVLVTTNSAKLLTESVFSTRDWQDIKPSSIHATAYKNGYLFFWDNGGDKGSGYIDLNDGSKGVLWFDEYALNTFLDGNLVQMINKDTAAMGGIISKHTSFNPEYGEPFTSKTFKWRSKTFNVDTPRRMLAAQVVADNYPADAITFRVYADQVLLHESKVKSNKPFRVKNHSVKRDFSIEIESSVAIREVVLAETMRDTIL
ncbi:hypothetical protein [Psychrobacter sp. Marseille-P5312]|uniref:hypothetical protein n=1 Tax=Psychrobacter sp. Marseille-P5312 TaxID=2086574 RepID=UPI000CF5F80F|nr:hypothetical protein [Psychrobacter sp. Marseille-P5312]